MNRRALLHRVTGNTAQVESLSNALLLNGALAPFSGTFDYAAARHLLNRCSFGATHQQIRTAVEDGLENTLSKILTNFIPATKPLNPSYENDPLVPIGETWVDTPFAVSSDVFSKLYRVYSLNAWTTEVLLESNISIQEKMTLFWHNHFALHDIRDARFGYQYITTLRNNSLGNFRELVKAITIDPMMLLFLNGHQNTAAAPNENYARELLELFTIGKGDLVAPGDYTNYTEGDIEQMAKVLTGWKFRGRFATDETLPHADFIPLQHDDSEKVLSNRFNNASIQPAGNLEYAQLIDLIFEQEEVSRFICRKFYRWFVNFEIDENIETEIIIPLAELLREEDYEILPVLLDLLGSDHFFGAASRGCMIKNPFDFAVGLSNTFEVEMSEDLSERYSQIGVKHGFQGLFQMQYFNPPTVAGWKAYYQEPLYYQTWLNSVTLPYRMTYIAAIANDGVTIFDSKPYSIDPLKLVSQFEFQQDANQLLDQLSALILPKPLIESQKEYLINVLLDTLPLDEWTIQYAQYAVDPTNEEVAAPIRNRLKILLSSMLSMAEYQLM